MYSSSDQSGLRACECMLDVSREQFRRALWNSLFCTTRELYRNRLLCKCVYMLKDQLIDFLSRMLWNTFNYGCTIVATLAFHIKQFAFQFISIFFSSPLWCIFIHVFCLLPALIATRINIYTLLAVRCSPMWEKHAAGSERYIQYTTRTSSSSKIDLIAGKVGKGVRSEKFFHPTTSRNSFFFSNWDQGTFQYTASEKKFGASM